jgi:N-acetylglucosaminyldiphosphoundecaprenol N-acetyl-beta-D-mannosaminyltransferase
MQTMRIQSLVGAEPWRGADELSREVFGVLGVPIDALGLTGAIQILHSAIEARRPFLVSTPNVNFLIASLTDPPFRDALLLSDLCPVDGMPIVWIARLLGVPLIGRVSGADIFNALKYGKSAVRRRTIFLFGGVDEAAAEVGKILNSDSVGLKCVDAFNPGFGSVEAMSEPAIVDRINGSRADILAVFLSAKKAQTWLLRNHDRLRPPVRAQFGATINFEAGAVRRAPALLRRAGLEWLWRIKEEPYLWRRYWTDGLSLVRLVVTCVLPLVWDAYWLRLRTDKNTKLTTYIADEEDRTRVCLSGFATKEDIARAVECFRQALDQGKPLVIDLADTQRVDPRFFGLILMVRKELRKRGQSLVFAQVPPAIRRAFRLNGFDFLLSQQG